MKKLFSVLLVVIFMLSSLGFTAFAADDYTAQSLGDGFTRLTLTNQSFEAGVERTFKVTIPEDGDYAVFIGNPNKTNTVIESTMKQGSVSKYVSRNWHHTGPYTYVRLGCPSYTSSGAVSSVTGLTAGEWTLSIKTTAAMTIPYIDIRQVSVSVDGTKPLAIYPMDAYSASTAANLSGTTNDNHAKASADYTYYGNLESDSLAVKKTNHGVLRIFHPGSTAKYRVNVKNPGVYKITGYGRFRKTVAAGTEQAGTINMTVGANDTVTGNHTFASTVAVNGWSGYYSIESTVELLEGVSDITFEKPAAGADWYINYVTVDRISDIAPEEPEPEIPDVPVDVEKPNDFPLNRTSAYLSAGETIQLTTEETVTWGTSDKTVATVSEDGVVTAVASGEAYISATTADEKVAACKVTVMDLNVREHETVPTPDVNGGKFLTDLFDKDKFKTVLTFDNHAEDITGNVNTTVKDSLTYDDGYHGRAASFKNGYVELTDAKLGSGSMTISTWIKIDAKPGDRRYIISTTPLNPSANLFNGFYTALTPTTIDLFYVKKDSFRLTMGAKVGTDTPADIYDGWTNITWVFDREKNRVNTYVDYEHVKYEAMYAGAVWDGEWAPMLGRGKTKDGVVFKYSGLMDDFFIYDGAMTADDLQKLKSYYKLGKATPVEGISLSETNLSLDINEVSNLDEIINPVDATIQDVIWTTSDPSVATVTEKGRVRGISQGTATITVTTVDGGFSATCTVTVGSDTAPFIYDRVCVIGLDGGGQWIDDDFMVNANSIFKGYATTDESQAVLPSITVTNWSSMFNGVGYEYHRLNNFISGVPYPTAFRILRQAQPDADMAFFCDNNDLGHRIIENDIGVYRNGGTDAQTHEMVLDYVAEHDPALLFVQYANPDHTGHTYGYGPDIPQYVNVMKECDTRIKEVYDAYAAKGYLDTTLFILTCDHGGIYTWHGGDDPKETRRYLGLRGKTVQKNSTIGKSYTYDVSAIIAHALGFERPDCWISKVPDGVFVDVEGDVRNEVPLPEVGVLRKHINTKTPAEEGSHLTDIFDAEKFAALLEFDDNSAKDSLGKNETTVNNTLTYEEGYFGKGANFSNGSVTLGEIELGSNDFTIGMWMKTDGCTGLPMLFANKEGVSAGNGFYTCVDNDQLRLYVTDGSTVLNQSYNYFFEDFREGWTHVMFVFNRKASTITCYIDFKATNGSYQKTPVATAPITIGSDGDANHPDPLTATLDDVFVYNGAMTADDIAKLSQYYSKEGTEIKLTDIRFEYTVSFDYTLNGDKTDATIYAAVYDENMKMIDVKKLPALLGGYGIENASNAKYLKAFVIDSTLTPKSVPATATKN